MRWYERRQIEHRCKSSPTNGKGGPFVGRSEKRCLRRLFREF